ncbi:hypothetical protein DL96DRAFT_1581480 [Flagelloscypha sp. PMI_526]|nr:hypothetical protein DL96DRAFT_1581480 [Flagelloscypha sp. PMI_526]
MTEPYTLRWGIISTGKISTVVAKDLLLDPKTRDVTDVLHKVVAIGSRNIQTAQKFIDDVCGGDKTIKARGTYEEVYNDASVDAIYIGTPHTYHYVNALDAIKAKKHVLCEKPVTTNAAELKALVRAAKENGVFFMEAMWTRFQPLTLELKNFVLENEEDLGKIVLLHADLSGDFDIANLPRKGHRMMDPELGGGSLLDLGPYPLIWALLFLYEHPANKSAPPSQIAGTMVLTPDTGVDITTSWSITFPAIPAQAQLSTSMNLNRHEAGVVVRFEKAVINISPDIYCPKSYTVKYYEKGKKEPAKEVTKRFEYVGGGWHWQLDEVARSVRDGKLESDLWGHDKSLVEMQIFDELRKQGGYVFPPGVEKVTE